MTHLLYNSFTNGLLIFGGAYPNSEDDALRLPNVWEYDIATMNYAVKTGATGPAVVMEHTFLYWRDINNPVDQGKAYLFGGKTLPPNQHFLGRLWELDCGRNMWEGKAIVEEPPPPRAGHSMTCDPANGDLFLYGGYDSTGTMGDFWKLSPFVFYWNATNLSSQIPANLGQRKWASMDFDSSRRKLILFGGSDENNQLHDDTWEYDLEHRIWSQVTPTNRPYAGAGASMVFSPFRGAALYFGGMDILRTWEYTHDWPYILDMTPDVSGGANLYDTITMRIVDPYGAWAGIPPDEVGLAAGAAFPDHYGFQLNVVPQNSTPTPVAASSVRVPAASGPLTVPTVEWGDFAGVHEGMFTLSFPLISPLNTGATADVQYIGEYLEYYIMIIDRQGNPLYLGSRPVGRSDMNVRGHSFSFRTYLNEPIPLLAGFGTSNLFAPGDPEQHAMLLALPVVLGTDSWYFPNIAKLALAGADQPASLYLGEPDHKRDRLFIFDEAVGQFATPDQVTLEMYLCNSHEEPIVLPPENNYRWPYWTVK